MPSAAKGAPPPEITSPAEEAPADAGASVVSEPAAHEYTAGFDTVYLAVPLTARPASDGRPATIFAWPDGAPADGRWAPTDKKPNQAPDNAPSMEE